MGDFDFLFGTWDAVGRRLAKPLAGSDEWSELTGTLRCEPLFGGAANFDEISFPNQGFAGLTLRLFDPEREEWWLYWVNSRRTSIEPPVVGRFSGGRGEFYGDDTYESTPSRVRYIWSDITPTSARWQQAFSVDGEKTWETNWIMEFTRRS